MNESVIKLLLKKLSDEMNESVIKLLLKKLSDEMNLNNRN